MNKPNNWRVEWRLKKNFKKRRYGHWCKKEVALQQYDSLVMRGFRCEVGYCVSMGFPMFNVVKGNNFELTKEECEQWDRERKNRKVMA